VHHVFRKDCLNIAARVDKVNRSPYNYTHAEGAAKTKRKSKRDPGAERDGPRNTTGTEPTRTGLDRTKEFAGSGPAALTVETQFLTPTETRGKTTIGTRGGTRDQSGG
jgi:hypothetical protein